MTTKLPDIPLLLSEHQGSLEHPYHFWAGYFMPACEWIINNPEINEFVMVECGPMTHWIKHLQKFKKIQIIKPRTALNLYLSGKDSVIFRQKDRTEHLESVSWLSMIDNIKSTFFKNKEKSETKIIIIERNKPLPFYSSEASEGKHAASDKRNIPNLQDLKPLFESQ